MADKQRSTVDATKFEDAERLWGSGSVDALFGMHDRVVTPWPSLPSLKDGPRIPSSEQLFRTAPPLTRIDSQIH